MEKFRDLLRNVWGILLILAALAIMAVIADIQREIWYLVLVLDVIFVYMMWRMDKQFYTIGRTKKRDSIVGAVVFLMMISATMMAPWNIVIFFFVILPLISFRAIRRRKRNNRWNTTTYLQAGLIMPAFFIFQNICISQPKN